MPSVSGRFTKGAPFLSKWYMKEYWVRPWGGASLYKTLLSTSSPPALVAGSGQHSKLVSLSLLLVITL